MSALEIEDCLADLKSLLSAGETLAAYDLALSNLERHPRNIPLRQGKALSLVRMGSLEGALEEFRTLEQGLENHANDASRMQTLGGLARVYKDLGLQASSTQRRAYLKHSHETYLAAFKISPDGWPGINAATTAFLLEDESASKALAQKVLEMIEPKLSALGTNEGDIYWDLATLGEAKLILRDVPSAMSYYRRARRAAMSSPSATSRLGDLASTRKALMLLANYLGDCLPKNVQDEWLPMPAVVVFAGHMIDRPGRPKARFPESLVPKVAQRIAKELKDIDALIGYGAGASGADLLFHEALRERGGLTELILPYERDAFIIDSVGENTPWVDRFSKLYDKGPVLCPSGEDSRIGTITYLYASDVMAGMARIRAKELGAPFVPIIIWDGKPGDGPGGTADLAERWEPFNCRQIRLDPLSEASATVTRSENTTPNKPGSTKIAAPNHDFTRSVKALLFADVVGYSKLPETMIPDFTEHFIHGIAELAQRSTEKPLVMNTWGDALYAVFDDCLQAALFALSLRDQVRGEAATLSASNASLKLNIRIGLHAGPVFKITNPITKRTEYTGSHVSRAARIEPQTPEGAIYASHEFAALTEAQAGDEARRIVQFEHVGRIAWAKGYGTFRTYQLTRAIPPSNLLEAVG